MEVGGNYASFFMSKINAKSITIFVFGILLLAIGIYFVYKYVAPKLKPSYSANKQHLPTSADGSKQVELLLFYADWCPHCKTAKPEWQAVKEEYDGKEINGYTILFTENNCTDETPENEQLMKKYKIQGFPTIKMLKDDQVIEFNAKPAQSNIQQFLQSVLQ